MRRDHLFIKGLLDRGDWASDLEVNELILIANESAEPLLRAAAQNELNDLGIDWTEYA